MRSDHEGITHRRYSLRCRSQRICTGAISCARRKTKESSCRLPDAQGTKWSGFIRNGNARGEKGMEFSQTGTTYHFLLRPDGGTIQVEAKDSSDTATATIGESDVERLGGMLPRLHKNATQMRIQQEKGS